MDKIGEYLMFIIPCPTVHVHVIHLDLFTFSSFSLSGVFSVCIVELLHAIVAVEGLSCFKGKKRIN